MGTALVAKIGTPAWMAFMTMSTGKRPLEKISASRKSMPSRKAAPTTLSKALWRPRSSRQMVTVPPSTR